MTSSGHPQYSTQQALVPGSVPPGYYAAAQPQQQSHMMYSYEDMQLLQQRVPMSTQLQQVPSGGLYMAGMPGVSPYAMYQYPPTMVPGVPIQYGAPPLYQYPGSVPVAGHSAPPQYSIQPKMIYANPSHPYYESSLTQAAAANAHPSHAQSKLVAPRAAAMNTAHEISTGIKPQLGKVSNPAYNSAAGINPSPYSPMIIPSLPPGATHPSAFIQHQMKPKY